MFEKLFQALKDLVFVLELSRRNADEIKELRKRDEEIMLHLERLTFEVQRSRENEAHEREKLLLRLENRSLELAKTNPRTKSKK